jgi:hypothetical protein
VWGVITICKTGIHKKTGVFRRQNPCDISIIQWKKLGFSFFMKLQASHWLAIITDQSKSPKEKI